MRVLTATVPYFTLHYGLASSLPQNDYGTFKDPSSIVRPRFRYWLPDSSVDQDLVKSNIAAAGSIGAGGVEYLPFFGYGGDLPQGADWVTYGFGTPAFKDQFKAALEAHQEHGLSMDFALGPNQGQGVPAFPDNEGLMWDLSPFFANASGSDGFNGTLPGWGVGELVAVVAAEIISSSNTSTVSTPGRPGTWYLDFVLRNDSLEDVTGQVSEDGGFNYAGAGPDGGSQHGLFAFYQRRTLTQNLDPKSNLTDTIFDYGCFTVDHFDSIGANVVIDFWEEYLLSDDVKSLLREVGHVGWEDSVELRSNISWSPTIPTRFQTRLGYDLKPFLPLIMFGDNNINLQSGQPGNLRATLDTADKGMGYLHDYRKVLQAGYQEYLTTLQDWLHNSLGLDHSAQVSYNLPMDMEASIPYVGVPECESLQFRDSVDAYRQFSGSANLAGKNAVSIELGGVFGLAYEYTVLDLAFAVNRAAAGGVNAYVIHGQTYTGNYFGTTWPGYTSFGYHVSDMYSEKRPDWHHGLRELVDYVSRVEWSQQQGVSRTDVAFYNLQTATDPTPATLYLQDDLIKDGWSYVYISPDNFNLPRATVGGGVLAPDGPAFKAMVIESTQNLTLSSITKLQQYAQAGLPIIVSGGEPGYYYLGDSSDEGEVENSIIELLESDNVYQVEEGGVANQLRDLRLLPNAGVQTNETWYTTYRQDVSADVDYVWVFGDTNTSTGEVTIASSKTPWSYDLWTGETKPLIYYRRSGNTTVVPLSLQGNQTALIVMKGQDSSQAEVPKVSVTQLPDGVLGLNYSVSDGLMLQVSAAASGEAELSDGRSISVNGSGMASAFDLGNWTLIAEHWEAPLNFSDALVIADKHNTTHELDALVSWRDIEPLANASGLGYYSSSFEWPPSPDSGDMGAYIRFPRLVNAILVSVNGQRLPPLDYNNPVGDISPYLVEGTNDVSAIVPTVMLNYILTVLPEITNMGGEPSFTGGPFSSIGNATDNGLIGEVSIVPYVNVGVWWSGT